MTDLRQAAQALLDRWDSPLWKAGTTAAAIADLRAALAREHAMHDLARLGQEIEQQAEPVQERSNGMPTSKVERNLRRMLCIERHGGSAYLDDGEASYCGDAYYRSIDYMRESLGSIMRAWYDAGVKKLAGAQPQQQAEPVALWQKRHLLRTEGAWENTNEHDAKWWSEKAQGWEIRALYTTPPQQQAEPVAWMDREGDLYKMPEIKNWAPPHTMLYTTSPQRQWVGLTDEDVNRESAPITSQMKLAFHSGMYVAQKILKEKNSD